MKPSIYEILGTYSGRLFIMPKPSGEWLVEDIQHYSDLNVSTVISMLEASEIAELSLQDEEAVCIGQSIGFANFPIPDRGLPHREDFINLVSDTVRKLEKGARVAVHCRAGIGRSGMLVCSCLGILFGSAEQAITAVSNARGVDVPDTQEQRDFILNVTEELLK